jgi:hypothetical protein
MKPIKYFRQLKRLIVLPKQFKFGGIQNPVYYSYFSKIFIKFLLCGLFKNEIQIRFGSNYWKHVPKYIFSDIPIYFYDFIEYKFNMFYDNNINHKNVQYLRPIKPLSPKFKQNHILVNEFVLEDIAKMTGFKVVNEKLDSFRTIYTISLQ